MQGPTCIFWANLETEHLSRSGQSTERSPGRGGGSYRTFELEKYDNETLSKAGKVRLKASACVYAR